MKMKRRDFLKVVGVAVGTAAVSAIPLTVPYKLPYWKDLLRVGESSRIVFRWDELTRFAKLTVDGIECDPRGDFCVRGGTVTAGVFRVNTDDPGTIMYNFAPRERFIRDEGYQDVITFNRDRGWRGYTIESRV